MKIRHVVCSALLILASASCTTNRMGSMDPLVGAWRGQVQFTNGSFAAVKDLEFMYAFNDGGTMTESSNYDGAPPVPPAYGIWRRVAEGKYELKYEYYWTKPPTSLEEITKGNGWSPGGRGVLTQQITLSSDGKSFTGTLRYDMYDQEGKAVDQQSLATAKATRLTF